MVLSQPPGVQKPIDRLKNPGNATLQMTYHQTLDVGLRSASGKKGFASEH
jgi:hypothetical protein